MSVLYMIIFGCLLLPLALIQSDRRIEGSLIAKDPNPERAGPSVDEEKSERRDTR